MKQLGLALIILLWLTAATPHADAPPASADPQASASYTFGQSLRFDLDLVNDPPMEKITLFVDAPQLTSTYNIGIDIDAAAGAVLQLDHAINLKEFRFRPFTTITYWWGFTTRDGRYFELPSQSFSYDDDTYVWKRRADDGFEIYWTTADADLGQAALDVGREVLPRMEEIIPVDRRGSMRIYLYPSSAALQSALSLTGQEWVGGSASPEIGVIMIPAENPRTAVVDMGRRLPHEMSHLLLYQATGPAYDNVPHWLDEGLAVLFQTEPNPNYAPALAAALESESLIPLADLCTYFPENQEEALIFTAYAQSHAFVTFLQAQYGNQALREMILAIKDGATCATMTERVLDRSLEELETEWLALARPEPEAGWRPFAFWGVFLAAGLGMMTLLAFAGGRRR